MAHAPTRGRDNRTQLEQERANDPDESHDAARGSDADGTRVRPVMLNGWLDGVASTFGDITGTQGRHADTAKRSTRHLGRIST